MHRVEVVPLVEYAEVLKGIPEYGWRASASSSRGSDVFDMQARMHAHPNHFAQKQYPHHQQSICEPLSQKWDSPSTIAKCRRRRPKEHSAQRKTVAVSKTDLLTRTATIRNTVLHHQYLM